MEAIDEMDFEVLRSAQDGIDLTERPYKAIGDTLGISEEEVIQRLRRMMDEGVIRRFAASIGHRALGIVANAMIAWMVPADDVDRVGKIMASIDFVTHCYERGTAPGWPYNLYTVVHARTREEGMRKADELSRTSGIKEYRVLFSEKEYKKTGARV